MLILELSQARFMSVDFLIRHKELYGAKFCNTSSFVT